MNKIFYFKLIKKVIYLNESDSKSILLNCPIEMFRNYHPVDNTISTFNSFIIKYFPAVKRSRNLAGVH
jgi:hypothetical protein